MAGRKKAKAKRSKPAEKPASKKPSGPRQLYMRDIQAMKDRGEKIVLAAPWDYNSTQIAEQAGADIVVIGGGTTAMMLGGRPHALTASMEDVLCLTRQVAPAIRRAVLYVSLPFGSFQVSDAEAVENAVRLMRAGAHAVKAQTPGALKSRAKAIIDAEIPYIGHVGLLPQLIYKRGGFRVFGKTFAEAAELYRECVELEKMGAMGIEMEAVPARVAAEIAKRLRIPVFGIGAGVEADGQFVVLMDVLGLQQHTDTKFSKKYADLWPIAIEAVSEAVDDVRTQTFPAKEHTFDLPDEQFDQFRDFLDSP